MGTIQLRQPAIHLSSAVAIAFSLSSCTGMTSMVSPAPSADSPTVVALSVANSSGSVNPGAPLTVTFSHSMMSGMDGLVVLHESAISGPSVTGTASWSSDRTVLTFTPSAPLRSHATYVLHLAPGLMGSNGAYVNLASCTQLGGRYASGGMMGGGGDMMSGSWGPGMMGSGWRAADGTFGMFFTFTTA